MRTAPAQPCGKLIQAADGRVRPCRAAAVVFGAFAGGLCEVHALDFAAEFGVDQFHPEYRNNLRSKFDGRK